MKISRGQSLFEVIFAVAVVSIIMVSVVSLSKRMVSGSDFSNNNALANKFALQATEWIRQERDSDWTIFYNRAGGSPTLCLSDLAWGGAPPCPNITGTKIFTRKATLSRVDLDGGTNGNESVEAAVIVEWQDGRGMHQVKNISRYTNWNFR